MYKSFKELQKVYGDWLKCHLPSDRLGDIVNRFYASRMLDAGTKAEEKGDKKQAEEIWETIKTLTDYNNAWSHSFNVQMFALSNIELASYIPPDALAPIKAHAPKRMVEAVALCKASRILVNLDVLGKTLYE